MKNKQRIVNSIMWGAYAMVGFVIAEKIFSVTAKLINRRETIDCEVIDITDEIDEEPE